MLAKLNTSQKKMLALALDPAAEEGEWRNAAVMLVKSLRTGGADPHQDDTDTGVGLARLHARAMLFVMPFGMYRGTLLKDLDLSYLDWLHNKATLKEPLKSYVKSIYEWRACEP